MPRKTYESGSIKGYVGLDRLPNGKVRARYRANGKLHGRVFGRDAEKEASAWRVQMLAEVASGTHVSATDGRKLFEDFANERIEAWRKHRETTRVQVESHMRNHVTPYFGDREIGSIRYGDVEAWVAHRSEVLAPSTLHVVFAWVRRIFADAVRLQVIRVSPCDDIELPAIEDNEVQAIPLASIDALASGMPAELAATVLVATWSGLRQGEILGLRRDRLDLMGRKGADGKRKPPSIFVAEQLQTFVGGPKLVPPKTAKSKRRVPIPKQLVAALAAHLAAFPAEPDGLIFTTNGKPITRSVFGNAWREAVKTAGLPKGSHFHALRHTYATTLIEGGESVTAVSRLLGHASANETLTTYNHLWEDSEDRTVKCLEDSYGALVSRNVSQANF